MSKTSDHVKDGAMKSEFNQSDSMRSMLEDCKKTRAGLYRRWNRLSSAYCQNYDFIKWEKENG